MPISFFYHHQQTHIVRHHRKSTDILDRSGNTWPVAPDTTGNRLPSEMGSAGRFPRIMTWWAMRATQGRAMHMQYSGRDFEYNGPLVECTLVGRAIRSSDADLSLVNEVSWGRQKIIARRWERGFIPYS